MYNMRCFHSLPYQLLVVSQHPVAIADLSHYISARSVLLLHPLRWAPEERLKRLLQHREIELYSSEMRETKRYGLTDWLGFYFTTLTFIRSACMNIDFCRNLSCCQSWTAFKTSTLVELINRMVVIFDRTIFISGKSNVCASTDVIM